MAQKPEPKIAALPRTAVIAIIALNFILMGIIYYHTDSPWGWTTSDLSNGQSLRKFDYLSILQLLLFSVTIDQLLRRAALNFNSLSQERHIPRLIIQVVSVLIYGFISLIGFILLYDHHLNNLIAATSGIGIGALLVFKDSISQVLGSVQLQMDKLVHSGDYLQISEDGKSQTYQVMDMAQRYITLRLVDDDYLRIIPNTKFLGFNYVNISKQGKKRGTRRSFSIELFSGLQADKVVEIFLYALKKVTANKEKYMDFYACSAVSVKEGAVEYKLEYESISELNTNETNSEILLTALRFLKAASIKIEVHNNHL